MPELQRPAGPLHYDITDLTPPWVGPQPTIVFHHGVGITSAIWSTWLPVLADRYRLVRFDTRGFGRSSVPAPGFPWSLDLLAEDVLAVARAAGAEQFHLVGESLGGTVGLCLATRHAAALLSLTVCSTSHRGASIHRVREWRDFIGRNGMAAWSAMMMPHRLDPDHASPAACRWFEAEQAKSSPHVTLDLADLLIGTDLTRALPTITTPTLVLAPGASPFVPLALAREIHALVPGSEMQEFAGVRHAIAYSHGPSCARALREFLTRRGLGDRRGSRPMREG